MRPSWISFFERQPGDLAADGVEAADDHHARRVVDDHVDAGRFFEGADVAPFAADDPALHFVVGNVDRAGRGFGRVLRGVALDGRRRGLRAFSSVLRLELLLVTLNAAGDIVGQVPFNSFEQSFFRVRARQTGDLVKQPRLFGDEHFAPCQLLVELFVLLGLPFFSLCWRSRSVLDFFCTWCFCSRVFLPSRVRVRARADDAGLLEVAGRFFTAAEHLVPWPSAQPLSTMFLVFFSASN